MYKTMKRFLKYFATSMILVTPGLVFSDTQFIHINMGTVSMEVISKDYEGGSEAGDNTHVGFPSTLIALPGCHTTVAYIPHSNPLLFSVAMAAQMQGKEVAIYIENTRPKIVNGRCMITNIFLKSY